MEYCASAASMLAEEISQIAEGFVEVPANMQVQLKICGRYVPKLLLIVFSIWKVPCDSFHNMVSTIGNFHFVEITMETFHYAERMV